MSNETMLSRMQTISNTDTAHKATIHKIFQKVDENNELRDQYLISGYIGKYLKLMQIYSMIPFEIITLLILYFGTYQSYDTIMHKKSFPIFIKKSLFPPQLCRHSKMNLFKEVLENNIYSAIKTIIFTYCALESPGIISLCSGLQKACKNLRYLDFTGNEIGVSGSRAVAQLITPNIDLQLISFQHVHTTDYKANVVGHIETLILSNNPIGDAGIDYIGKAMSLSNTIKCIEVESCDIGDNGVKYLRRGIEKNESIETLNIAQNKFGDLGAREIQSLLLRNKSLIKLDASRNRLGAERTMNIAKGCVMNRTLKHLKLNINRISARGATLLGKMLINNQSLEVLEISYNEIYNAGMQTLSQGLAQNHGIKKIVAWHNGLEDAAMRHIGKALAQRSKLPFFKDNMKNCILESIQNIMDGDADTASKSKISEIIADYLPIYMDFEIDISFNRRITDKGRKEILNVANSVLIDGIKTDLLMLSKKERSIASLSKTSIY